MESYDLSRRLTAEALGTGFLVAAVVGSGIMAEALAGGNVAVALLCNAIATGAVLFVIIAVFMPLSGAHFNPAVSFVMMLRGVLDRRTAAAYIGAQIGGGCLGTIAAHMMFDLNTFQLSLHARNGLPQWFAEFVATFGLLMTILGCLRFRPDAMAAAVGLYITSAYWFTATSSFANPAVTIARSLSDTFSGIAPGDVPAFLAAQFLGAAVAAALMGWLLKGRDAAAQRAATGT
jgi:glycerol uptake facilitator-like aquaporin